MSALHAALHPRSSNSYVRRPCPSPSPSPSLLEPQWDSLELFHRVTGALDLLVIVEHSVGTVVSASRLRCANSALDFGQSVRLSHWPAQSSPDDYTGFLDVARRLLWQRRRAGAHSWEEWHRCYGHLSFSGLRTLATEGIVKGFDIDRARHRRRRARRVSRLNRRTPFPVEASNRSNTAGERVMNDEWGPACVLAKRGHRYYISCTDDATRFCVLLFTKLESDVFQCLKDFAELVTVRYLRVDNGTEYIDERVKRCAASLGMEIEHTAL